MGESLQRIGNRNHRRCSDRLYQQWLRRVQGAVSFKTVSGCVNEISSRSRVGLRINTSRVAYNATPGTQRGFTIAFRDVHRALDHLVVRGLMSQRDLFVCTCYTATVMGLLLAFSPMVCRTKAGRKVLVRLTMVRMHIGGLEHSPTDLRIVVEEGGAYIIHSFYHLRDALRGRDGGPPAWLRHCRQSGCVWMCDCGLHSFMAGTWDAHSMTEADWERFTDDLGDFIERFQPDSYVAPDVPGDWPLTRRLLNRMLRRGLRPIPVFHFGDDWAILGGLVRLGVPVIGLGKTKWLAEPVRRDWYAEVFRLYPKQAFHSFALGSLTVLSFPFYSADVTPVTAARTQKEPKVLTDVGQLATTNRRGALRRCVRYIAQLGNRSGRPVQLRLTEALEGEVAGLWAEP